MSRPRNKLNKSRRAWGSLFKPTTICSEVVERPFDRLRALSNIEGHQIFNALDSSPTEPLCYSIQSFLCLSCEALKNIMGAVKGTGVLWVSGLKRDPHAQIYEQKKVKYFYKIFLGRDTRIKNSDKL